MSDPIHVKIGPVDLFLPEDGDITDRGLNATTIRWYKHYVIDEKKIVRHKPQTQCTQPIGLWCCEMHFSIINKDKHQALIGLNAGPYMVQTASMEVPCWIEDISFEQEDGTDDETFDWTVVFKEQYPSSSSLTTGSDVEEG